MGQLQELGLGRREIVSDDRDKFMVNTAHPHATRLTPQPDADGFIRSDGRSLLLRNPSATVQLAIAGPVKVKAKRSTKRWEFSWGVLEEAEIDAIFAAVRQAAGVAAERE
jgi:hypothetical protein